MSWKKVCYNTHTVKKPIFGKVGIGWVICRLREQISLKRYFKYLMFGYHLAPVALIGPTDAEGVGRKGTLPRNAIGTPKAFYTNERRDGIYRYISGVENARNLTSANCNEKRT